MEDSLFWGSALSMPAPCERLNGALDLADLVGLGRWRTGISFAQGHLDLDGCAMHV